MSFFTKRVVIFVLLVSFIPVLASSFVVQSEVCCMFHASKAYGWPNVHFVVYKVTDNADEAMLVHTQSLESLFDRGWDTNVVWGGVIANFFLYASALLAAVFLWKKAKALCPLKKENNP